MVRNRRERELQAGFVDIVLRDATKMSDCRQRVWGVAGLKAYTSLLNPQDGNVKCVGAASPFYLKVTICGDAAKCCGHQEYTVDDDSLMPPFPTIFSPV